MKTRKLKWLAFGIGLCLLFSSCAGAEREQPPQDGIARGRYVEEQYALPEDFAPPHILSYTGDGVYFLLGYSADGHPLLLWQSENGGISWERQSPDWLHELNAMERINSSSIRGAFNSKGEACLFVQTAAYGDDDSPQIEHHLFFAGENGLENLHYSGKERIRSLALTQTGDLLIDTGENLECWNRDLTHLRHTFPREDSRFAVCGNTLITAGADGSFALFDLEDGEQVKAIPHVGTVDGLALTPDGDGLFYYNTGGLYRVTMDGAITEQVIDGRLSSFGIPYIQILNLIAEENDSFLALCSQGGQAYVKKLVYDRSAPTTPGTQLAVYSLYDNPGIRSAGTLFSQNNPNILVDFQVGLDGEGAGNISDAMSVLSTQLLSGNGPDILVLDGLPLQGYIEKGVLLDIGDLDVFSDESLLPGIVASYRQEEGIYSIPTKFLMPVAVGPDQKSLSGPGDVTDWLEQQEYPLTAALSKGSMEFFLDWCLPRWFQADGSPNASAITADLQAVKAYDALQSRMEKPDYLPGQDDFMNQAFWWGTGRIALMLGNISSISEFADIHSALIMKPEGSAALLTHGESTVYLPLGVLGINAQNHHIDSAKEFLRFALSAEMQSLDLYDGLPVCKAVWEEQLAGREPNAPTYLFRDIDQRTGNDCEMRGQWLSEEGIRLVGDAAAAVNLPVHKNAVICELILTEVSPYLTGSVDVETAVENLSRKIRRYLDEG